MTYRLGLRLTLLCGKESLVRLLVTAGAVAVGVAIILSVLADFNAFEVTSHRPAWEATQGRPVTGNYARRTNSELWNYSNDIYRGQTIERLDLAALGHGAPVPPGISKLPAAGQYFASPALAQLIRAVPADQLGDRFPGKLTGTIGQQALTGPDELVIYIGEAPAKLVALPATTVVSKIATAPAQEPWNGFFRKAFIAGAIAFLFPILILVSTATRLAAARREERYAALRLVGATSRQVSVVSSVDAVVSALFGTVLGIVLFALLQPELASTAVTSARYFADDVTPGVVGYAAVIIGVPAGARASAVLSLERVRISPMGVSRRVTPPAPARSRVVLLLLGVGMFGVGIPFTSAHSISQALLLGLIVIPIGLVVAGPWLTAEAARMLGRVLPGAGALLASRRLTDNPKGAFRSVSVLVLAVFLGTIVAGILPTADSLTAPPSTSGLNNVLVDGFTAAPVCGNDVNCGAPGATGLQSRGTAINQRIALAGLPPATAASLLHGLTGIAGATAIPVYSRPAAAASPNPAGVSPVAIDAVMGCKGLRELVVLGRCAPGRAAVVVPAGNLLDDNPHYSTQPIAGRSSPAASADFTGLYLQALLVKVNSPVTLEKVRTYLVAHATQSASGLAPRTFGEEVQARAGVAATVQRLIYIAVALTLVVAGCSLAVTVGGSLIERKRPFTLLRVTGTQTRTLYWAVLMEAGLPLLAATVLAMCIAYGIAVATVSRVAPPGTPFPVPDHAYFMIMGAGLAISFLTILASLPLLGRITRPAGVRFE